MSKDVYEFAIARMDRDADLAETRRDIAGETELTDADKCDLYCRIIERLMFLRRAKPTEAHA